MHLSTKVCVWRKGEREKERKRESNTENGAESNPIMNGKNYCKKHNQKLCNTITNVWHQNMQIVRAKSQLKAKHHQKTNMWFNPHSNSTMYARSPMMLCSQHDLMQEMHNPLEITIQLTPLTTKQKLKIKPVLTSYMLYYWLYSKPCHVTSYTPSLHSNGEKHLQ
jgi:hypothetical protein